MIIKVNGSTITTVKTSGSQITGEKIPGDLTNWCTYENDINEAVKLSYGELIKRSLTLYRSYAPVTSAIDKTTAYAVGKGCIFRSRPDHRILGITIDQAKEWGKQFQLYIHYYFKKLNWYAKQGVVFSSALSYGDSLVYFVRDSKGLDLIEVGGDTINWEYSDDKNWTLGIKHDQYKRRKAIYTTKPINFVNQKTGDQQVLQFFIKEAPRQLRGLPLAYKIIALAKNHDRHMDATVQRAVLESIMFAYSNTDKTDFGAQVTNQVAAANRQKTSTWRSAFSSIFSSRKINSGNVYQLKTGESFQFTDLKTPSNNFDPFNAWMIKFVAMATGTTPGVILSNYPTSYSSHRGEFNDFWKMVLQRREFFNQTVNKVVIREVAKELIFDGKINAPGFFEDPIKQEAWLAGSFLGPVPGQINPKQEVEAYEKSVKNSFQLRGDIASLYGNEWDNTIDEWGEQEKKFSSLTADAQSELIQEELQNVQ